MRRTVTMMVLSALVTSAACNGEPPQPPPVPAPDVRITERSSHGWFEIVREGVPVRSAEVEVALIGDSGARLLSDFRYTDAAGLHWTTPATYEVDGASIPRFLWTAFDSPWGGRYGPASVVHDWYCDEENWSHGRTADAVHRMFLHAMLANGVAKKKALAMFYAVDQFGPQWDAEGNRKSSKANPIGRTVDLFREFMRRTLAGDPVSAIEPAVRRLLEEEEERITEPVRSGRTPVTDVEIGRVDLSLHGADARRELVYFDVSAREAMPPAPFNVAIRSSEGTYEFARFEGLDADGHGAARLLMTDDEQRPFWNMDALGNAEVALLQPWLDEELDEYDETAQHLDTLLAIVGGEIQTLEELEAREANAD